jgi:hypothetical protein
MLETGNWKHDGGSNGKCAKNYGKWEKGSFLFVYFPLCIVHLSILVAPPGIEPGFKV